jgi:hypothetical protein
MTSWNQRLIRLENRLQTLIEGSAARLFPEKEQMDLPFRLVAAMNASIRSGEDDRFLAPNLYLLKVHPSDAANLVENQAALLDLGLIIQQAGLEAGLSFNSSPMVKVLADPGQRSQQLSIEARITSPNPGRTKTLIQEISVDAQAAVPRHAFLIVEGNKIFPLDQSVVNIGRRVDNHLSIEDPRISRLHAQLRAIDGHYTVFDLNSTGGTFVNGERVKKVRLKPGDVISLAGIPLVFGQDSATLAEETHGATHPIVPYPDEE